MAYTVKGDVDLIRAATYGLGTNLAKLADAIGSRPNAHVQEVRHMYRDILKQDVTDVTKRETGGLVETVLHSMVLEPEDRRAVFLHDACAGTGTDEMLLVSTILAATQEQLTEVHKFWAARYKLSIMARIMLDGVMLGPFHYLLEQSLCPNKPASGILRDKVDSDLKELLAAGEGKIGTDEKAITKIFAARSREHLRFLDEEYRKVSPKKKSLSEALRGETNGKLEAALIASIVSPAEWYEEQIFRAMKGAGTREESLVRHILLASDKDLKQVASIYKKRTGNDLAADVAKELSGDLKTAILPYVTFHTK